MWSRQQRHEARAEHDGTPNGGPTQSAKKKYQRARVNSDNRKRPAGKVVAKIDLRTPLSKK